MAVVIKRGSFLPSVPQSVIYNIKIHNQTYPFNLKQNVFRTFPYMPFPPRYLLTDCIFEEGPTTAEEPTTGRFPSPSRGSGEANFGTFGTEKHGARGCGDGKNNKEKNA